MTADRTTEVVDTPEVEQVETDDSSSQEETISMAEYKKLQADYTKKSQRLAELEKKRESSDTPVTDEEKQLNEWLEKNWYVRKEQLEQESRQIKLENDFSRLLASYPELSKHEKAIRDLQASNWWTFEEVAIQYGFTTQDKIKKAMSSKDRMVGSNPKEVKQKSISEMTSEEYSAWKKVNGVSYSSGLRKS